MRIHTILFCVLLATFFHLFYKPRNLANSTHSSAEGRSLAGSTPKSGGPFRLLRQADGETVGATRLLQCASSSGFRCENARCDCENACPGLSLEKQTTAAGTYCLPGKSRPSREPPACDPRSSSLVYAAPGWTCRDEKPNVRNGRGTACKSEGALDNAANVLVDVLGTRGVPDATAPPAPLDADVFETFLDEQTNEEVPRYRCRCGSSDDRGNRMISPAPHLCVPDYCTRELKNRPNFGWNGRSCECGPFPHADPDDLESPCVPRPIKEWSEEMGVVRETVPCMQKNSVVARPVFCPEGRTSLSFVKRVSASKDPLDFVSLHKDSVPRIRFVNEAKK